MNTIFNIYIWQTINFILAIVNRRNAVAACEIANFHQDEAKGNAILLDFKIGAIFGFANCDQAIQAGLIGIACSLLFGSMFAVRKKAQTFYFSHQLISKRLCMDLS